jgi:hypothetical protein
MPRRVQASNILGMCFRKRGDCPFLQAFQMLDGEKTKKLVAEPQEHLQRVFYERTEKSGVLIASSEMPMGIFSGCVLSSWSLTCLHLQAPSIPQPWQ